MANQNQSLPKASNADSLVSVTISAVLILGSITALIIWALQSAYAF